MMQTHLTSRADVHRRTQANGFQSAENFDRFRVVLVPWRCFRPFLFVSHESSVTNLHDHDCKMPITRSGNVQRLSRLGMFTTYERKACLRTDPYVALPFDLDRSRPELVGFLAPSRLAPRAGETSAKTRIQAFQASSQRLLARAEISQIRLAEVLD